MKHFLFKAFAALLSIYLISCSLDDDDYSLDDVDAGFGIIYEDAGASLGYKIKLDQGDIIFPTASVFSLDDFKDSSRVLVYYTILGNKDGSGANKEYFVKINSMRNILMKGILDITGQNKDSIGNDPVIVKYVWISNNLLNFELKYWGDHEIHYINLVKQPGALSAQNQPIELELRHNSNGDYENIPYVGYVSFDLSAIKIAGLDSVHFKIKATDYDGKVYSDDGVYKYSGN